MSEPGAGTQGKQSLAGWAASLTVELVLRNLATNGAALNEMAKLMYLGEVQEADWAKLTLTRKRIWINRASSAILGLLSYVQNDAK